MSTSQKAAFPRQSDTTELWDVFVVFLLENLGKKLVTVPQLH